jgi:hypothetical protein
MTHISTHIEPHISVEAHPHPDTLKADQGAHPHAWPPVSTTPDQNFFAHALNGQPSGLLARLPVPHPFFFRAVLPGDASTYYIRRNAGKGLHQLYIREPSTGMYKQTPKRVAHDGKGGWWADSGLKGGLNYTPEARAARLQEARESYRNARAEYRHANVLVKNNKRSVIISQKKVSDLKIWIGQTQRSIENKTHIVDRYASACIVADDDLTGALNQRDARRNQLEQQPQNETTRSKLATAEKRYNKALQHRDSAQRQLISATSALVVEHENFRLQRLDLADAEHDLSLNEALQTMAENDLAKARVKISKAEKELKMAQA